MASDNEKYDISLNFEDIFCLTEVPWAKVSSISLKA